MAQQSNNSPQPPWQYSEYLGDYFVFKPSADRIFLQSGEHFPRPANMPASSLANASYEGPLPPPGNNGNGNNGQRGQRYGRAMRSRGRGRGRGRSRGRGPSPGRGRGQVPYHDRQAGTQQPSSQQPWPGVQSQPYRTQMPQTGQGLISGIDRMTLASQGSSSQAWAQQQSNTGISHGYDPETQVQSLIQKAAPEIITPPEVLAEGIVAHSRLLGTESGDSEKLDSSFKIRSSEFFCVGRVFKILWAEPAGPSATVITRNTFDNVLGERVHAKVRWFVVIREGSHYCCALPIFTYAGQGVAKRGVVKSEHGIIYTGKNAPRPSEEELDTGANEERMRPEPIQVDPDSPFDRLDPMSRINFAGPSTVQHNVKVKNMGKVNERSMRTLRQHFQNVWFTSRAANGSQIHPDQQGLATNATVHGHAGSSRGRGGFNVIRAGLRGPFTTAEARHGRETAENSDDEIDEEDAEGGAASGSSDGSDGEESEEEES